MTLAQILWKLKPERLLVQTLRTDLPLVGKSYAGWVVTNVTQGPKVELATGRTVSS